MLVSYNGQSEIIVTTKNKEAETVKLYFTEGGRDLDEYDRQEHTDCGLSVLAKAKIY